MTGVVDNFGWRYGYLALAGAVIIAIVPIALIMRRQPEDMGLLPDGITAGDSGAAQERTRAAIVADDLQTHTRSQAIATSGFWLLILGYGLNSAALGSVVLYAIPFATSVGFARSAAAAGLGINGIGNLMAKAVWGWGLQRFDARRLAGIAFSTSASGVLLMVLAGEINNTLLLMVGFYFYGFGFGGTIPISTFLWARFFGRRHIGAIRGLGRPATLIFSTGGPIATGLFFDVSGSYVEAFLVLVFVYLLGAVAVNFSKIPTPIQTSTSESS
jgi:cyanate permease